MRDNDRSGVRVPYLMSRDQTIVKVLGSSSLFHLEKVFKRRLTKVQFLGSDLDVLR